MQLNINDIMAGAWMLWSSDAAEHDRCYGSRMGALVVGCSRTSTILWLAHGCSGDRMQPNMTVIMVRAWVLWSSDAVEHQRYYGWRMDALVVGCSRT